MGTGRSAANPLPVQVVGLGAAAITGSVTINGGAAYTTTTAVNLTLSATDSSGPVSQMMISNDGVFDTENWEPYPESRACDPSVR